MGREISWANCVYGIALGLASWWFSRKGKRPQTRMWWTFILYHAACLVLAPPHSVYFAGLILCIGGSGLWERKAAGVLKKSEMLLGITLLPLLAAAGFYGLTKMIGQTIVLTEANIAQSGAFGYANAPRDNIRISAVDSRNGDWLDNRRSWLWFVRDARESVLAPRDVQVSGGEVYFHNFRLLRGNTLARRIADWAQITPDFRFSDSN